MGSIWACSRDVHISVHKLHFVTPSAIPDLTVNRLIKGNPVEVVI